MTSREQFTILYRLLPFLWPRGAFSLRVRVVAAMALIVLAKLVNIAVPYLLKRAIDVLTHAAHAPHLGLATVVPVGFIMAYGAARFMAQATGELRELVFEPVSQRSVRLISESVFAHLHALSLRFHLERQTGAVTRALERGAAGIEFLLGLILFNVLPTLLEIVLVAAVLTHLYRPVFAVSTVLTVAVYAAVTVAITQWRTQFRRDMLLRDAEANARAVDALINYETVKYFGNEAHEARRFDDAKRAYESAAVKSQATMSLLNVAQGLVITVGVVWVMVLAARGVAAGSMSVGDFVLVNGYILQLYQPLNQLGTVYRNIKQSLIDLEAMYRLLRIEPEVRDAPGAPALAVPRGVVRFEHVGFAYDPRRPILRDIGFEIPAGRTVAIVGASGSGKSTVARLLFRFFDVSEGAITIDGQDIRAVTQASLRQAMGVVPQDTVLFNDTILYNIAYGRPDADGAAIEEAARLAHIHDFIASLPDGYRTRVGERGLKLSGGEKQRVAIARVILKAPRILIFDEATSALDSFTEQEIQSNLREVAENRTTLVIAHRLSTIVDADAILVLEHGRVVERGRHAALLAEGGRYAAMWSRQRRAEERGDDMTLEHVTG